MTRAICMTGKCDSDCPQNCMGRKKEGFSSVMGISWWLLVLLLILIIIYRPLFYQ